MQEPRVKRNGSYIGFVHLLVALACFFIGVEARAQVDQGAIAGVVTDVTGAVIPGAQVKLTDTDTGLVLESKSDRRGYYIFSPIKIGSYNVSVAAPGFETTSQENVKVNIQDRLNIAIALKPGSIQETVTVSSGPPLLQSDSGSVGQVVSAETINETPLNGRNYVYIAQLTAGVAPSVSGASRGGGSGDFFANGQRATQNNFIMDGVDNNVNVDDFMNGASYNVRPPPDALAEFKIDTSNYSAEFGHSAGAVVNASIKSGTNKIHGDLWEYARNTALDAQDWDASSIPAYHENQFGATLGLPVWRNKIFYFGDAEVNRIAFSNPFLGTVPTPLMRQGNFTELFNPSLTGASSPEGIFAPNTGGQLPLTCGGASSAPDDPHVTAMNGQRTTNILCTGDPSSGGQQDKVAAEIFNAYPAPNANGWTTANNTGSGTGGLTYNNYKINLPTHENTWQWDQRVDWNISDKDQTYARYSYTHAQVTDTPALGPVIDGGNDVSGFQGDNNFNLAENFMGSETHLFTPALVNEFRFGYNWGNYQFLQANSTVPASTLIPGMNGVPFGPGHASEPNGGLPYMYFQRGASISAAGARRDVPSIERQNIYQILDNVTKSFSRHSLKLGLQLQTLRTSLSQPQYPRGRYRFSGTYTSLVGTGNTGSGMADAFTDNMASTAISPDWNVSYYRWYRSGYAQDDWRINSRLTMNLGLRYDYVQPISSKPGAVANFVQTGQTGQIGTGTGIYQLSSSVESSNPVPPSFEALLATQNVSLEYVKSKSLTHAQKFNFAPRVGFAYQLDPKSVLRGGYGIFFGGVEAPGAAELTVNYPWAFSSAVYNNSPCLASASSGYNNAASTCQSTGTPNTTSLPYLPYPTTLETGISAYINGPGGTAGLVSAPVINTSDVNIHTPYTESYNLTFERSLSENMVASLGYVGNVGRHLYAGLQLNDFNALLNPNNPTYTNTSPFPGIGQLNQSSYSGISAYNSLQAKIEKRFSKGLSFLGTYTWSHALDDTTTPGGIEAGINARNTNLIPLNMELTNSPFDVRNRVTVNGFYELPFGNGHTHLNSRGVYDYLVGGWSASLTWAAQTGNPLTISPGGNFNAANGGAVNAVLLRDPFGGGGTPDASNTNMAGQTCPTRVRTKANWYNPCAFGEPKQGTVIPTSGSGQFVQGAAAAIEYLGGKSNQIYGPGYERVNMSLFKNVKTFREEYVQLRVDAFNLLNTPSLAVGDTSDGPTGGAIYTPQTFQALTPDSRFFQIAAKYVF